MSADATPTTPSDPKLCELCPKMCRFACPVAAGCGDETATPTAMMQAAARARGGKLSWEAAADALERCTGCEACRAPCEFDQDLPSMVYAARAEAWEAGAVPPGTRRMHDLHLKSGNPFGIDVKAELMVNGEDHHFDRKGRVLYWPGCRMLAEQPEELGRQMDLLRELGADHVSLPARKDVPECCGAALGVAGDVTGLQVTAAGLQQYFNRQRTWVTGSSACLRTVRHGYTEAGTPINAEVLHIGEYLLFFRDRMAELGRLAMERADRPLPKVVVHDACGLQRRLGRGDPVHEVIEAATGQAPESYAPTADRTVCCGAGDFHDLRRPGAAAEVLDHALSGRKLAPGSRVVTGDIECLGSLRQGLGPKVRVDDLLGFLLDWLEPALPR